MEKLYFKNFQILIVSSTFDSTSLCLSRSKIRFLGKTPDLDFSFDPLYLKIQLPNEFQINYCIDIKDYICREYGIYVRNSSKLNFLKFLDNLIMKYMLACILNAL